MRKPILIAACLVLAACSSSQIVASLSVVVDAADAAVAAIGPSSGLSPAAQAAIQKYLGQVAVAADQSAAILAGTETAAAKGAKIAAVFAGLAVVDLPPGTPQTVANIVQAVAKAVGDFLAHVNAAAKKAGNAPVTLSTKDSTKLMAVKTKATKLIMQTVR